MTGPKYRQIADDLREAIGKGEYPPGGLLPTKAELMSRYHVAINTVERAIDELRRAGVVETVQGAGMFVREAPRRSTAPSADTAVRLEELSSEIAGLREEFDELKAQVMNLYSSMGQPYPQRAATSEPQGRVG